MNEDPYGAWLIKVENITEKEELLTAEEKKYRDCVLTGFFTTTLDKPVKIGVLDFEPHD